ncbi:52 kDa repressor of the inhibitor of the protein kinase-like [Diabrotica virgifera virgifera]|uniref:HAT C-terminal dimerisation domain-containing protein n=1 Tax=Diabrotica virgifera virgifera TaxID=50390 RepID=A0ABM5L2M0_DIAVI|nr:52 kDa repressor of the inhibitor of the protein kinase-like [Diabrotica virgifera virgifera]
MKRLQQTSIDSFIGTVNKKSKSSVINESSIPESTSNDPPSAPACSSTFNIDTPKLAEPEAELESSLKKNDYSLLDIGNFIDKLYEYIVEALEVLQEKPNRETSVQALQLSSTIMNSEFIITLLTLNNLFSFTVNLTKNLQKINVDLVACVEYVDLLVQSIQSSRDTCDRSFNNIYKEAEKLVLNIGGQIAKPRTVSRQTQRGNIPAEDAEQYYLRNLYIPFIDHILVELKDRFSEHHKFISHLQLLIPEKCVIAKAKLETFKQICELYDKHFCSFSAEFHVWQNKWINANCNNDNLPRTAIEAFLNADGSFFPNIKDLLQILATLPCSTATPERTFSTLRRLKSWLRNSTLNERLNGLALMSVHRDIRISSENVIERFCLKNRNIPL